MMKTATFRILLSALLGASLGAWAATSSPAPAIPAIPAAASCCEVPAAPAHPPSECFKESPARPKPPGSTVGDLPDTLQKPNAK